ncbi:MAG: hypothetical protein ABFD60_04215 [Bryobacteraceae bacterium]
MAKIYDLYKDGRMQATLKASAGGGGVLSIQNDSDKPIFVEDLCVRITTPVAGQTFDAGIAANGTTSAENLIDGGSLAAAARLSNSLNPGTNGRSRAIWLPGQFLTITASGTPTGLAGTVDIYGKEIN